MLDSFYVILSMVIIFTMASTIVAVKVTSSFPNDKIFSTADVPVSSGGEQDFPAPGPTGVIIGLFQSFIYKVVTPNSNSAPLSTVLSE